MGRHTLRRLLAVAAILWLGALAPVFAQTVDDIIKRGKLLVAIDTTTPPYGLLDAQLQPAGFDIEFAQMIGKAMGVPVEFVTVNSPGRIPALLTNRVDLVVSIFSITAERALQVAFSTPYAGQSTVIIGPKSRKVAGPKDLSGLKVGLTRGATEDKLLTDIAAETPGITILRFDDYPSLTQAMLSGQVDIMAGGDYGDIYLKKSAAGDDMEQKFTLKTFYFGVGVRRNAPDLLRWVNTYIFTVKTDGTLQKLSQKWRKQPLPDLPNM